MKPKILTILLLLGAICMSSCAKDEFTLTVLAKGENGCEITGDTKIAARYGENLTIPITIPDGKSIVQVLSDGVPIGAYGYADGFLTLGAITEPQSIQVVAGDPANKVIFTAEPSDTRGGKVTSTISEWKVPVGSVATFTAILKDGAKFLGWSENKSISRGGKVVSDELVFTTVAEKDMIYYANFDASGVRVEQTVKPQTPQIPTYKTYVDILYMANGGTTSDGMTAKLNTYSLDYYTTPNTLPDNGTFVRDGYVLVGYSTDPDGNSGIIAPGHKYLDFAGGKSLDLYCIWKEAESASSFKYSIQQNGTIAIDGYTGSAENLYVPCTINGQKVTTINSNAFNGASMKSIYLPSSVTTVRDNAFVNCKNLTELTMFDSVLTIGDASFNGTTIHKLNLYAASNPRYSNSGYAFGRKFERLMLGDENKVVIVAGSSKLYGIDSLLAEELLGGDYTVVNYGTNAQMSIVFFLEAIASVVDEGDIVVYSPEQYAPYTYWTSGNPEFTAMTYQACESYYQIFSMVDISNYTLFFDTFAEYSQQRSRMQQRSYDIKPNGVDNEGDLGSKNPNLNSKYYHNGANGVFKFCDNFFIEDFIPNMNRAIEIAQKNGASVYFSHPPYNRNACDQSMLNDESYDTYHDYLSRVLSATLISDVRDYILGGEYFSNTDYHTNDHGQKLHTEQLMKDILAQLEKEEK